MKPTDLDLDAFDRALTNTTPLLVDFWAEWCGPCKTVAPVVAQMAADYAGRLVVGKVDTDTEEWANERFQIRGIPLLIVFEDGEELSRLTGAHSAATISQWLDSVLPESA